jgi:hypothetical protein
MSKNWGFIQPMQVKSRLSPTEFCVILCAPSVKKCGRKQKKGQYLAHSKKNSLVNQDLQSYKRARDWIRTSTPFRAPPPQSGASTNFATRADSQKWTANIRD